MKIAISPLSANELEFLRRAENEDVHDAYAAALASLHGLAARYTGSMYFVMVPDEDEAVEMFKVSLAELASTPHLAARMRRNLAAYEALKEWAARNGLTAAVREAATRLMHACSDERQSLYATAADGYRARHAAAG